MPCIKGRYGTLLPHDMAGALIPCMPSVCICGKPNDVNHANCMGKIVHGSRTNKIHNRTR